MSAAVVILVIIVILLCVLLGMIKFTKLGQKWFCPAPPVATAPTPDKKE